MSDDGERGKRDGMGRAERAADPVWWQSMLEAGKEVAELRDRFTVDHLLDWMHLHRPGVTTHELRAAGPLMVEVGRLGYAVPTDRFVPSRQPLCHKTPRRVWASLICGGLDE